MQESSPGVVIAGKYRLTRMLGQGGMGAVWHAQHLTLHSPVAIKLIDPAIADNAEALGRFLREAQAAASLRSPHVVQILDHGVDNGVPYIAMELLDGESLADRLARVGRLSPGETARVLQHVARAIARAHEAGIVHRDLKPDNIYLVKNDDEEIAKVLDFGIAKSNLNPLVGSAGGGTRTGAVLGTPYYMSPEQAEGAKSLDGRSDIWAMGVIAFECLLGSRPFDEETLGGLLLAICARPMPIPSQRGPVPPGFDHWFTRVCARDMNQRIASARDAAAELRQVCEGALPSGNYAGPLSGPAPATPVSLGSGAVSGQSLPGFASTQMGRPTDIPVKSRSGLLIGLAAAAIIVVGGGLFVRSIAKGSASAPSSSAVQSSAPPSTPNAATTIATATPATPLQVEPSQPTPAPVASAASLPVPAPLRPAAGAKPAGAMAKPAHAKPIAPASRATPEPPPPAPAPKPAPADNRVNLGI